MKKFILVMVFVLLTALFIAFNYLLWDRESKVAELKNLEYEQASYNADINARKREIAALEDEVGRLQDEYKKLEMENSSLNEEKKELNADWTKSRETLQERIDFINVLKQYTDVNALSEPVLKWVDAVNQGNYEEAYALEYESVAEQDRPVSLVAYAEGIKNTISMINITDVKLDKLRGSGTGDIYLNVKLDVKLVEEPAKQTPRFSQGENEVTIRVDYSYSNKKFIIISTSNM